MTPTPKPTDTFRRVYRGGTWFSTSASFVRAACRVVFTPTLRDSDLGFRCAQRGVRRLEGDAVKPTPKPTDKHGRPVRGGARGEKDASYVRAACRFVIKPTNRSYYLGFRCLQRGARVPRV